MSNASVYAGGILNRALDPSTQPPQVQALFQAERDLIRSLVRRPLRMVDIGCGTGRHLGMLANRLTLGVGVDYELSHIAQARRAHPSSTLRFVVGDATRVPLDTAFDLATCLFNTWGTMEDQAAVLAEMRRLSPRPRTRLLTVYSVRSVPARRTWYTALGDTVVEETEGWLRTAAGFRSEHFTERRLRELVGECRIEPLSEIAYAVVT